MQVPAREIEDLNFREYYALLKRKHSADDMMRLNFGYVYAAIYNCAPFGDPKREPVQPTDIVPRLKPEGPDMTKMSPKGQKNYLFWVFQGAGKKVM